MGDHEAHPRPARTRPRPRRLSLSPFIPQGPRGACDADRVRALAHLCRPPFPAPSLPRCTNPPIPLPLPKPGHPPPPGHHRHDPPRSPPRRAGWRRHRAHQQAGGARDRQGLIARLPPPSGGLPAFPRRRRHADRCRSGAVLPGAAFVHRRGRARTSQGHGGPVVLDLLLAHTALSAHARRSRRFTERAFLNRRMDLAQAEGGRRPDRRRQRPGRARARLARWRVLAARARSLAGGWELRLWVEAAIDFPEDIDFRRRALLARADALASGLDALLAAAVGGCSAACASSSPGGRMGRVLAAQPPGRLRGGDRHRHPGHDARRAARRIALDGCRCTSSTPPACAIPTIRSAGRHPPCLAGSDAPTGCCCWSTPRV